ncbi:MAG: CopG family transcriptional regulator [Chloroflexi bacterium]|nr:CopG family transcriptional regulator [Chloroflexota bacterium]
MQRKQVYLEEEQGLAIKRLAARRGVSGAVILREALAQYLASHETPPELERPEDHPLWGIVGIGASGVTDAAANHDHHLYGAPKVEE